MPEILYSVSGSGFGILNIRAKQPFRNLWDRCRCFIRLHDCGEADRDGDRLRGY